MTKKRSPQREPAGTVSLREYSFEDCVRLDPELAATRAEYAKCSPKKRRQAAEWTYDSAIADRLFGQMLAAAGQHSSLTERTWPEGVEALAIDPRYAPALLTVGDCERHFGRPDVALRMFLTLTTLPADEPDLAVIIDKAGDALLDAKDVARALTLYETAEAKFPGVATYPAGASYCLSKLGRFPEAVAAARRADALEPNSSFRLTDLGWALFEAGQLADAEATLVRAVALADASYELPRENLKIVRRKLARQPAAAPVKPRSPRQPAAAPVKPRSPRQPAKPAKPAKPAAKPRPSPASRQQELNFGSAADSAPQTK